MQRKISENIKKEKPEKRAEKRRARKRLIRFLTLAFAILTVFSFSGEAAFARNDLLAFAALSAAQKLKEEQEEREKVGPALFLGAEGEGVKILQERLIKYRLLDGEADGIFGPLTEAAVAMFQEAAGILEAGVGAETLYYLGLDEDILELPVYYNDEELPEEALAEDMRWLHRGDFGRLCIPSVGISVALYVASPYDYDYAQWRTDCEDSAVYYDAFMTIIGDHNYQEFRNLDQVEEATEGYIELMDGTKQGIICIDCGYGKNLGFELFDQNEIPCGDWQCDLATYTCSGDGNDIFVAKWALVEWLGHGEEDIGQ